MELKESDTFGEAYTGEYRLWINNHVLTNAITNPTGGIEEFEGGLSENNLQKLQGTIVHETLLVLGLHHDSRNGRPGINALEYVPWGTDNIFYDTLNGIDDGRTVNNYIF